MKVIQSQGMGDHIFNMDGACFGGSSTPLAVMVLPRVVLGSIKLHFKRVKTNQCWSAHTTSPLMVLTDLLLRTKVNPVILAKYVVALLKKDKPLMELQKLCVDNLVEFLGDGAKSFTTELFQVLENGTALKINNESQNMQPFQQPSLADEFRPLSDFLPNQDNILTSTEQSNNFEDQYVSEDNDDDDRNHKYPRREEAEPNSVQNDTHNQFVQNPNKKCNKLCENMQESDPALGRNYSSKFNNHHPKFTPNAGLHTRFNQPAYFDLSASVGRPICRTSGWGPWNQDLRFNSPDTLASHTNPFVGPNSQTSWGGFGFISDMANSLMDPVNPLGLQGALWPNVKQPLNIGQPHRHCRDFEEQGFCLRGDMCPLEHGSNCIVVQDVQSLSWFNLAVTNPSSHALGVQNSSGALHPSSSLLASSESTPIKIIKSGTMGVSSNLNNISSTSISKDAYVYDPDQPLWNNDVPTTSTTLLRHSSPNIEDKSSYDVNATPLNTHSSTCWQIRSENKPGSVKMEERKEDLEKPYVINQNKGVSEIGIDPKSNSNYVNKNGKLLCPKALRTLYVNGIPRKRKKRNALITHFQKFGEVIEIYFPLKSDQGFVQFFKREAAEAALNSPDAIMGNRFIKLSWANHDRVLDNGPSSGQNKFIQPLVSKLNTANGVKGVVPNSSQKSNIAASNTSLPVSEPIKNLISKSHKSPAPKQKMKNLELLRELRKKQESLAKKRNDFRRQLEEFAKQIAPNKKGDVISEQAAKRQKVDASSASIKAADKVTEKKLEKNREVLASNGSKTNPLTVQKPLRNIYQTSSAPVLLPNRYKLDNRSTSFKILPPLPVGFANATALWDHFSCYGVITSAVVEDPGNIDNRNPTSCEKLSACITFANRKSAEKAFVNGKCWWGCYDLNLKWLTATQNLSNNCSSQETSSSLPTSTSVYAETKKTPSRYCLPELMCKSSKDTYTLACGKDVATASQKCYSTPYRGRAAGRRNLHGQCSIGPVRKNNLGSNLYEEEPTTIDTQEAAAEAMNMTFGKGSYARKLLEKMGWKDGEALGSSRKGILEPLQTVANKGNAGLGWKTTWKRKSNS